LDSQGPVCEASRSKGEYPAIACFYRIRLLQSVKLFTILNKLNKGFNRPGGRVDFQLRLMDRPPTYFRNSRQLRTYRWRVWIRGHPWHYEYAEDKASDSREMSFRSNREVLASRSLTNGLNPARNGEFRTIRSSGSCVQELASGPRQPGTINIARSGAKRYRF
jgi:hypothetical protein